MRSDEHEDPVSRVIASGQHRCWDERGEPTSCRATGQDGDLQPGAPWPEPRFESSETTVRDRLTGLMWTADANHFEWPLTWDEANEAVADLSRIRHLGRSDWRLPNRRELWSLVSFAEANPALPSNHPFHNVFLGWYWSSTTAARNPSYAWAVQMTGGRVFFEAKERYAFTWACRGTSAIPAATGEAPVRPPPGHTARMDGAARPVAWPSPRFSAGNDWVFDRLTGLGWARHADLCGGAVNWADALEAIRGLNARNASDQIWRLPGITELESLLDARRCDPALPADQPFTGIGSGYWSSTTSALEHDWAMVLHLGRGAIGVGVKCDPRFLVWPVTGPCDCVQELPA